MITEATTSVVLRAGWQFGLSGSASLRLLATAAIALCSQLTLDLQLPTLTCGPPRWFVCCVCPLLSSAPSPSSEFAFKCHRDTHQRTVAHSVNAIVAHPIHSQKLATVGGDGKFVFWDREKKVRDHVSQHSEYVHTARFLAACSLCGGRLHASDGPSERVQTSSTHSRCVGSTRQGFRVCGWV